MQREFARKMALDNTCLSQARPKKAYYLPNSACNGPTIRTENAMVPPAAQNARTFSLQSPADLYRKLRFEARALHNHPPADLTERAYAVMNAVTSAWQMKDWVYRALADADQLDRLHQLAGRKVVGAKDFGRFLAQNSPWMDVAFQLATAAKHFDVNERTGPEVVTAIDFELIPGADGELAGRDEIMVRTRNNSISGPGLVLLLEYIWGHALVRLDLLPAAELEA